MVVAGLIVQAIKLAAGSYVKDIDPSKLTASLWNGSVHLERLELKPNVFDQFNLPFRLHRGFAEKVKIVVPISNLYKGKWEVEIGALYLSAGPITSFEYDQDTADRESFELKQRQLQKVESAKVKAALEKEGKEEQKGFFGSAKEFLVAHLLKVVEIQVGNVHIRYEDAVSHPSHPFACGVTMEGLYIKSTNGQWEVGKQSPSDEIIFKLAQLNNLGVYWNANVTPTATFDYFWESFMKNSVAKGEQRPPNVDYIFGPVSASAKVQFSTVGGAVVGIPVVKLELGVGSVSINLSKLQYDGVLCLMDAFDRMVVQKRFFQYRPSKPLSQLNGKDKLQWFRYAANCVISVIHKRTVVWSWEYIKSIRRDFKTYQERYKKKLLDKKPSAELLEELKKLEMRMSLFNIVIARSRAESDVKRMAGVSKSTSRSSSWFGWMWSSSETTASSSEEATHVPTEEELEEEKEKLFESIGYSEGVSSVKKYPLEYVAYAADFQLEEVSVDLHSQGACVASLGIKDAVVHFSGRPAARAVRIEAQVDSLVVKGGDHDNHQETIITSKPQGDRLSNTPLLKLSFEVNPLPSEVGGPDIDQKVSINLLPVKVLYDAATVDGIIRMLQMPAGVQLHRLLTVAQDTLDDIRLQTRAGLEHALTTRNILDVNVHLKAPYLLVPYGGKYSRKCDVVVVDLGSLSVTSDWRKHLLTDKEIKSATVDQLQDAFYDKFTLQLKDTQILIGRDEEWVTAQESGTNSHWHILNPTRFDLTLKKSLIFNDPQRPNIIITGKLPDLELQLSDQKIVTVVKLLKSLPLPPPALKDRHSTHHDSLADTNDVLKELMEGPLLNKALPTMTEGFPNRPVDEGDMCIATSEENVGSSVDYDGSSDDYETASECSSLFEGEGDADREGFSNFSPPLLPKHSSEKDKVAMDTETKKETVVAVAVETTPIAEDDSPEKRSCIIQAKIDVVVDKVVVAFSVKKPLGGEVPRLTAEINSLELSVMKRTFDLTVDATIGLGSLLDHSVEDPDRNKLMWSQSKSLLAVKYVQVDCDHPKFSSEFGSVLKLVDATMSEIGVGISCDSAADLLSISKQMVEGISSGPTHIVSPKSFNENVIMESISRTTSAIKDVPKTAKGATEIKVVSRFGGLYLSLWNRLDNIMVAEVKDLASEVTICDELTIVKASIGDLYVRDPLAKVYSNILKQNDPTNEFITVEFKKLNHANLPPEDTLSPHMSVCARLKELEAVILFKFLRRIQAFASRLTIDHRMMKSAKEAASNAAARTVETLQEHSSQRISLDIVVHAPVVSLPLTSTSHELFEIKFGELYVRNKFHMIDDVSSSDRKPVCEVTSIILEEAAFFRVVKGEEDAIRSLLTPVYMEATIKRNLSPWYQSRDFPRLASIALHLNKTTLGVADDDLVRVLQLMAGNISDGFHTDHRERQSRHPSSEIHHVIREEGEELEEESGSEEDDPAISEANDVAVPSEDEENSPISPELKFSVNIDSIGINLYRSGKHLEVANPSSWDHQSADELASFALKNIAADLVRSNFTEMNFELSVGGCVVRDLRKEQKSEVKEFLQKSLSASDDDPFLFVSFAMSQPSPQRQLQIVSIEVPNTQVIVDIQFLYSLEDFAREILSTQSNVSKKMVESPMSTTVDSATSPSQSSVEREFQLTFTISHPNIGIVAADSKQESMLLLTAEISGMVKSDFQENRPVIKVSTKVSDLRLSNSKLSSLKDPSLESSSAPAILKDTNFTISYSAPSTTGKDLLLMIETDGSMDFVLSPSDVRLLLSVAQSAQRPKKETVDFVETPKDLWTLKDIDYEIWYLQADEDERSELQVPMLTLQPAQPHKEEEVTVDLGTVSVTLNHAATDVERGGPAFKMVATKVSTSVYNWSSEIKGSSSLTLQAAYYNNKFNVWEYVLEPLEGQNHHFNYWTVTAEINSDRDLFAMKGSQLVPKMQVSIVSNDPMQITLSRTSIGQLLNLADEYSKPVQSEGKPLLSGKSEHQQVDKPLYKIQNLLGQQFKMTVVAKDKLLAAEGENEKVLGNGEEAAYVSMVTSVEDPSGGLLKQEIHNLVWSVTVSGFHPAIIVHNGCNTAYYPLKSVKGTSPHPYGFVVEAELISENVTLIKIRSPVQVYNKMEEPCLVAMTMKPTLTSEAVAKEMLLNPEERKPLPLDIAHEGNTFVKLQNKRLKYSTTSVKWSSKSDRITLECPRADGVQSGPPAYYIRVVAVKETYIRRTQLVNMADRAHHILSLNYPIIVQNNLPHRCILSSNLVPKLEMGLGDSAFINTCPLSEGKSLFGKQQKISLSVIVYMGGGECFGTVSFELLSDKVDLFTVYRREMERTLAVNKEDRGSWKVTFFSPYWLVNKAQLTLDYFVQGGLSFGSKSENIVTQHPNQRIALLKLPDDMFKKSTELKLRISKTAVTESSSWSKPFSLDAVGSCGVIKIEYSRKVYHFGIKVSLSQQSLTKIITISPFFLLENLTTHHLKCYEPAVDKNAVNPIIVRPKELVVFHPSVGSDELQISLDNHTSLTLPFNFTIPGTLLLRTKGDTPAIVAQVKATVHATLTTFSPYYHGAAPFLVVNDLKDLTIEFEQNVSSVKKSMRCVHSVLAGHTYLYTWDTPSEKKEIKCWIRGREKRSYLVQTQDASGKFKLPRGFKQMIVLERTAKTMLSEGGSRRTSSSRSGYSGPVTPIESDVSGAEDVDGVFPVSDRWLRYDEGSSGEEAYDSDFDPVEETDSDPSTPVKKTHKLKKLFSFGKSSQDLDLSLVDKMKGRWISFMDGIQRVLLFTLDKDTIKKAQRGQLIQRPDLGLTASLESAGLSLVDDVIGKEVAYLGISPCPIVWEWEKRRGYWRSLNTSEVAVLEDAYQVYLKEMDSSIDGRSDVENTGEFSATIVLQNEEWKITFGESITMTRVKGQEDLEHSLRRSKFPGVFLKYTTSANQITFRATLFSLQVDNQLSNPMFSHVIHAIPPPPSIASSLEPKPLVDTSVIIRRAGKGGTTEFKLIQVVLQKIGMEVELGFVLAVLRLFSGKKQMKTEKENLEADMELINASLKRTLLPDLTADEKNFIDNLLFSPVHIVLSLSLTQSSSSKEMELEEESVGIFGGFDPLASVRSLLHSVGAFVVDVKDADLKLNRLEASQLVLTRPELIQLVRHHYTQQILLKLYKVVFNLNVIGNPVGLVGGIASGVTDLFYEPYKAVMLGPEEFVEAVGIGVHSALGGTVGGALGVVSTFTGKLGDAAALLSKNRGERERRRVENKELSITYGFGKLIKDVGGAFTNVVIQPVKGAQSEGVVGFLKGAGRGVFGIALRPLGGALDLTTIAVDKLRKVTKIDDYELVQLRLPRYIGPDQVIHPYSWFSATGKAFFEGLEPNASEDLFYVTHFEIKADPVKAFLITNKFSVLFSQGGKLDILNKWDRDVEINYDKLTEDSSSSEGTLLKVKVKRDSTLSKLFSSKDVEQLTVQFKSEQDAKEASLAFNKAVQNYRRSNMSYSQ